MPASESLIAKLSKRVRQPEFLVYDARKMLNRLRRPDYVRIRGVKVPVEGAHTTPLLRHALYTGTYEMREVALLAEHLTRQDVVLEVGGGIGFISAFCCRIVEPQHVHVYEA